MLKNYPDQDNFKEQDKMYLVNKYAQFAWHSHIENWNVT